MSYKEGKKEQKRVAAGASLPVSGVVFALFRFSLSGLRGRSGQAIPVTLALLLIVGAAQAIGALGDVSSKLTRQQIAASWRTPADLLVRPQAAVSQPERDAGWINPQGVLENYGGISAQQVATIASLSQVTQIVPFASVGWQRIDVVIPVLLQEQGLYRITAQWTGAQQWAGSVVDYVEVSDLATLTHETPALKPIVQHLVLQARAASVVYALSMPALQLLVGAASMQEDTLRQLLQEGRSLTSPIHPTIHVDRLDGQMTMLLSCMKSASQNACWQPVSAQEGPVSYQARGVQLLRYSQAQYSATAQQIAAGQPGEVVAGEDAQGAIYRSLLPQHLALASDGITGFTSATGQPGEVLPLNAPQHMAALPGALQFIPLAQACLVNGKQCYSGLYIRLRRVDSYNSQSLALLQASAAAITARTGLHVDILDGSSTRLVTLVSGHAHSALAVRWRVVGVAVQITRGVDALQNTLFLLCALICLLAIGAAGVLIGIGRRNEARTLEQLGWSNTLRVGVYLCSALLLALPGCALASLLILLAHKFWPGNLPVSIPWGLLAMGIMIYTVSLVSLACGGSRSSSMRNRKKVEQEGKERMQAEQVGEGGTRAAQASEEGMRMEQVGEGGTRAAQALPPFIHTIPAPPMAWLRRGKSGSAFHARITAPLVCSIAISATIFLIAIEYLMVNGLNRELVVTVLGDQVRVVLEGPQLFLLLLVLLTALLTVGLCTSLLLRGRREELALLAKVGWERRHVLLRLLRESWWMAALSGLAGALLALVVITGAGSLPQVWIAGGVLLGGLLVGMALVSLVVYTLARQELQNVYLKRA